MKVVLFCGGLGTRLREHSDTIPKPLVNIGDRPILWHLMRYYAYFGHTDFVICLGYEGKLIKDFFVNYERIHSGDFSLQRGVPRFDDSRSDVADWNIQFVDTGLHSNIGERLRAVKTFVENEDIFLANYSDQLSDLPLPEYLTAFENSGATAGFVSVRPAQSYHIASMSADGHVTSLKPVAENEVWINGGYLALRRNIFDFMRDGEELVEEPFQRLIDERLLFTYRFEGFWKSMDTFKDKIVFDRMWGRQDKPWEVWKQSS